MIRFKAEEGFYFLEEGIWEQRLCSAEPRRCCVSLQTWPCPQQHPCMVFPSGTRVVGAGFAGLWVPEEMQLWKACVCSELLVVLSRVAFGQRLDLGLGGLFLLKGFCDSVRRSLNASLNSINIHLYGQRAECFGIDQINNWKSDYCSVSTALRRASRSAVCHWQRLLLPSAWPTWPHQTAAFTWPTLKTLTFKVKYPSFVTNDNYKFLRG